MFLLNNLKHFKIFSFFIINIKDEFKFLRFIGKITFQQIQLPSSDFHINLQKYRFGKVKMATESVETFFRLLIFKDLNWSQFIVLKFN